MPPAEGDANARIEWEHTTIKRFGQCATLHADCVDESYRRLMENTSP